MHWQSLISARISHASSAQVKTSLRIIWVFETSKSLQIFFYRPSLWNVKDLAYKFNIPEGLRISATIGVVEQSWPTPLIHRRGLASLSIVEPIAVKPLCLKADQFRAVFDSPSKYRTLTFRAWLLLSIAEPSTHLPSLAATLYCRAFHSPTRTADSLIQSRLTPRKS